MKKRNLLRVVLITVIAVTLFAFPGSIYAKTSDPVAYSYTSIISSPFNEPITIEKNYSSSADALSAAKNMAHAAMYRADIQAKIATLSNEEFIIYLYDGLFNRTPDAIGYASWLNGLNNGLTKSYVIDYFINSPEFEMRYIYTITVVAEPDDK